MLYIYMDAFLGPYRNESRYFSLFATVYIILRIINLILFSLADATLYFFYAGYVFILVLVLLAVVRPYRNWWQNFVDVALLLSISTNYLFRNSVYEINLMSPADERTLRLGSFYIVNVVSLLFPAFYMALIVASLIIPNCCIVKLKEIVNGCLNKNKDFEETLPHRLNECSPLTD